MNNFTKIVFSGGKKFLLRVETSPKTADYLKYEVIRNSIWELPEDHMSGTRNMMCQNYFHEGSCLYLGAFSGDEKGGYHLDHDHLAAFCYGFVGVEDKSVGFRELSNLRFYSQFTGVREEFQSYGLSRIIKEFQREIILTVFGIRRIICTYDPLTAINAYRNISRFGMDVLEYRVAAYGTCGGRLSRTDIPRDRFLMSWDLERPFVPASGDTLALPQVITVKTLCVKGKTGLIDLEVAMAVDLSLESSRQLIRIPSDFYGMLYETDTADPEVRRIPLEWRLRTREAFTTLFARGYKVRNFFRWDGPGGGSYYLLEKT